MLAGIVFEDDYQTLDELVENCHTPEVFDPLSDSYWASKAALELAAQWHMTIDDILAGFADILDELRLEYSDAAADITRELLERKAIPQQDCEAIYRRLDQQYDIANRPSMSDIIYRMIG